MDKQQSKRLFFRRSIKLQSYRPEDGRIDQNVYRIHVINIYF